MECTRAAPDRSRADGTEGRHPARRPPVVPPRPGAVAGVVLVDGLYAVETCGTAREKRSESAVFGPRTLDVGASTPRANETGNRTVRPSLDVSAQRVLALGNRDLSADRAICSAWCFREESVLTLTPSGP